MMDPLRVVVFTRGGLGLPVSERLAELPGVQLAAIACEQWTPRRWTLSERLRRYVRYYGYAGAAREIARAATERFRPSQRADECSAEAALEAVARGAGADFIAAANLHAPDILGRIAGARPDLGVVVGSGILKPELFNLPRRGSINVHQAKVPEYRGSAPLFWALYDGETETRVTIHQVVERVDAGEVILEAPVPFVYDYDRYGTDFEPFLDAFRESLAGLSVDLMVEAVRRIAAGMETRVPQDEARAVRRRMPTYREKEALRAILRRRYARRPETRSYSAA